MNGRRIEVIFRATEKRLRAFLKHDITKTNKR